MGRDRNSGKKRSAAIGIAFLLASCGSSQITIENDTNNAVMMDVVSKSTMREPSLRRWEADHALASKVCAKDAYAIWVEMDSHVRKILPETVCDVRKCDCDVKVSQLLKL